MGFGKTDQPGSFAYGADFQFVYKKPQLRPGMRKNQKHSYDNTVDGVMELTIGGIRMMGVIQGGVLSVYPVDDVMKGIRMYYTWQELYDNFTWDEVDGKTWGDLFNGDEVAP